jgi:HEAT repeat protein
LGEVTGMDTRSVPDWYVEAVHMIGHTDGVLRNLELELLDFMQQCPDWRVQRELLGLVDSLHGTAGALALVAMAARRSVPPLRSTAQASSPSVRHQALGSRSQALPVQR